MMSQRNAVAHGGTRVQTGERAGRAASASELELDPLVERIVRGLHPNARARFAPRLLRDLVLQHSPAAEPRDQAMGAASMVVLGLDTLLPQTGPWLVDPVCAPCVPESMRYVDVDRVIASARSLGTRLFLYLTRDPLGYSQEIIDLALKHEGSVFVVLSALRVPDESFAADCAAAGNVGVVVRLAARGSADGTVLLDPAGRAVLECLRAEGVPAGFSLVQGRAGLPPPLGSRALESLVSEGFLFGVTASYFGHAGVGASRSSQGVPNRAGGAVRQGGGGAPVPLLDVDEISFIGEDGPERRAGGTGVAAHYVDGSVRELSLLESMELASLGRGARSCWGAAESQAHCSLHNDPHLLRRLIVVNL